MTMRNQREREIRDWRVLLISFTKEDRASVIAFTSNHEDKDDLFAKHS